MEKLRVLRKRKKMTQAQLADLAGTSQPQIRKLEAGERKFTKEWADRLAPFLGVSPQALLYDETAEARSDLQQILMTITKNMPEETLRAVVNLLLLQVSEAERAQLAPLTEPPAEVRRSEPRRP
jgi:transcriptional regulator with XRE-family HTH domain